MYALRFKSNQKVFRFVEFKGAMVSLRHFRTTESPLKIMKSFLKAVFVLEIFAFLSCFFYYLEKPLYNKIKVNSKIYDVTDWTANYYNTQIA